jgi:hypothetical protein
MHLHREAEVKHLEAEVRQQVEGPAFDGAVYQRHRARHGNQVDLRVHVWVACNIFNLQQSEPQNSIQNVKRRI